MPRLLSTFVLTISIQTMRWIAIDGLTIISISMMLIVLRWMQTIYQDALLANRARFRMFRLLKYEVRHKRLGAVSKCC